MFDVEHVLSECYPELVRPKSRSYRTLVDFLRALFHQSEIQQFEKTYRYLAGFDFIEQVLSYFDVTCTVRDREVERIPAFGRVVIISNHPIGSLDALALLKLVRSVRPDVKIVANAVLSKLKALEPVMLQIDRAGKTSHGSYRNVLNYLNEDGAVIIFPSGKVSRFGPKGVRDGKWYGGFLNLAKETGAPILPIHINGRNSVFFYALSVIARPISSLWLIHEMFKQENTSLVMRVGERIDTDELDSLELGRQEMITRFKRHVYRLGKNRKPLFKTREAIAHPENRQQLRRELLECERLGDTADGKQIYLYRYRPDSAVMREIGRLRELSFRAVGEGTLNRRDIDRYDTHYMHLVLWDENDLEIVGAYRLCDTSRTVSTLGIDGIYTSSLFHYRREMKDYLYRGLELGRSFVQPRYWGKRSLDYLWYGIGALLRNNPQYRYLFGPVSISDRYPAEARDLLVYFYSRYFGAPDRPVEAIRPHTLSTETRSRYDAWFDDAGYAHNFKRLKAMMQEMGYSVPTLFKQYTEVTEAGGTVFSDFNIDGDFSDCVDGFVIVDTEKLKQSRRTRYIDRGALNNGALPTKAA